MPVRKLRDVAEMNRPVWRTPGDPRLMASIAAPWERGARLSGRRFVPGVRRYRSIGELEAAADAAAAASTER